jgi:hypothetical protein
MEEEEDPLCMETSVTSGHGITLEPGMAAATAMCLLPTITAVMSAEEEAGPDLRSRTLRVPAEAGVAGVIPVAGVAAPVAVAVEAITKGRRRVYLPEIQVSNSSFRFLHRVVPRQIHSQPRVFPHLENLEHFPRIQDALGVEGALDRLHRAHLRG